LLTQTLEGGYWLHKLREFMGPCRGNRRIIATFPSPERPIAQYVKISKALKAPCGHRMKRFPIHVGKSRRVGLQDFQAFNWIITAKLLHLREIGVYHTATAA
jgi:hypothetical protein